MNNLTIETLKELVNPVMLHGTDGQYKVLDIMTVEELEAQINPLTRSNIINTILELNKVIA